MHGGRDLSRDSSQNVRRGLFAWMIIGMFIFLVSRRGIVNSPVDNRGAEERFYDRQPADGKVGGTQFGESYSDKSYFIRDFDPASNKSIHDYCSALNSRTLLVKERDEAMRDAQALMEQYLNEHSAAAMFPYSDKNKETLPVMDMMAKQDSLLCHSNRSFVVGTYACPLQVGNRVHEFLNAFAGAVITNRTLVWNYCDRMSCKMGGTVSRCDAMLQRKGWILSATMVTQRLERGGCIKRHRYRAPVGQDRRRLGSSARMFVNMEKKATAEEARHIVDPVVPKTRYSVDGEGLVACCGIDTLPQRILDFGVLERYEMFGLSFPGSNLGPRAQSRAQALFGAGREYAYGLLFRNAFEFSEKLNRFNSVAMKRLEGNSERGRRRRLSPEPNHDQDDEVSEPSRRGKKGPAPASQEPKKVPVHKAAPASGTAVPQAPKPKPKPKQGLAAAGGKWGEAYAGNHTARLEETRKHEAAARQGGQTRTSDGNGIGEHSQGPPIVSSKTRSKLGGVDGAVVDIFSDEYTKDSATTTTPAAPASTALTTASANSGDDFVLAVHVRHMQARDSGEKDSRGELNCISEMLSLHVDGFKGLPSSGAGSATETETESVSYPCKVLLASDRHATLHRLTRDVQALGCRVIIANHEEDYTDAEFKSYSQVQNRTITKISGGRRRLAQDRHTHFGGGAKKGSTKKRTSAPTKQAAPPKQGPPTAKGPGGLEVKSRVGDVSKGDMYVAGRKRTPTKTSTSTRAMTLFGEHGPWRDSFAALADIHLLSHAHAFIGSADDRTMSTDRPLLLSTYSMLIAELIRTGDAHNKRRRAMGKAGSDDSLWEKWLPDCGVAFGSYRMPQQPAVRSVETPDVEIAFGEATAAQYGPILKPKTRSVSALHKISIAGGNGHYEPSLCNSFSWGAKCYQMKTQRTPSTGMGDICLGARTKNGS